ncbi:sushi, nidogen and EGF-like domain-containing protein 1 [Labeo rohita]|uniref:sushi, nidogen and EGF-like domain-containing protein 1 n=1 Tax=Labeo rohita TaxID=84645 RepID=UPI0021E284E1|nr:sushi, nidogen and EGF-like domain-containing protein 1 [Labeo rohita]
MDNRINGTISYRQVTSGGLLLTASNNINQYFPNLNFTASWLFIATWDKVPYFYSPQSKSTFQVVLVSGKNMSFTLMHYGHIAPITFRFLSGYDTSDSSDSFLIPVSNITNLPYTSNVNVMGRWVFRVDHALDHNDLFYPFGNKDIKNPSEDDGSSPVILLEKPFVYFGRVYRKTYVNNNGHLTFDGPLSQAKPINFQSYLRDIIAPLWIDMDNTVSGTISYRQVTSGKLLLAATDNINQYFPNLKFSASWLFIATWDKVPYYNNLHSYLLESQNKIFFFFKASVT